MRALGLSLVLIVGCHRNVAGDAEPPLDPRLVLSRAMRERDLAALERFTTDDAALRAELSRALFWVGGLTKARPTLDAVCSDARLEETSTERSGACALRELDVLVAGRAPNELKKGGAGPLLDKQKLLIAMVSVNGLPAEPFIVDTGAPMTVLSKRYADRTKLPYRGELGETSHDAAGNEVTLHPLVLDTMTWGELELATVPAWVLELPENFKVGGILAPQDVLRGTAFELDGPARALRTGTQPPATALRTALHWSGGNFYVEARASGVGPLPFLFDSGAGANGVCEAHAQGLDGGVAASSTTAAGSVGVRTGIAGTFAVGDEPDAPAQLFVTPCVEESKVGAIQRAGYVGAPWFYAHRTFFPVDRRAVAFVAAP